MSTLKKLSDNQKNILFVYFSNGANEHEREEALSIIENYPEANKYLKKFKQFEDINIKGYGKSEKEIRQKLKIIEEKVKKEFGIKKKEFGISINNKTLFSIAAIIILAISIPILMKNLSNPKSKKYTYENYSIKGTNNFPSTNIRITSASNTEYLLNKNKDSLWLTKGRIHIETNGSKIFCGIKDFNYISVIPLGTKFTIIKKDSAIELAVLEKSVIFSDSKQEFQINEMEKLVYHINYKNKNKFEKDSVNKNFFAEDTKEYEIKNGKFDTNLLKNVFNLNDEAFKLLKKDDFKNVDITSAFILKSKDGNYNIITEEGGIIKISKEKVVENKINKIDAKNIVLDSPYDFIQETLFKITEKFKNDLGVTFIFLPKTLGEEKLSFTSKKGDKLGSFIDAIKRDRRFKIKENRGVYIISPENEN